MAAVGNAVQQMSAEQIAEYESKGSIALAGEVLNAGDIKVPSIPSPKVLLPETDAHEGRLTARFGGWPAVTLR